LSASAPARDRAEFTISGPVNYALLNFNEAMADIGILLSGAIDPGLIETERFVLNIERVMRERS
jgi:hypothetical protein